MTIIEIPPTLAAAALAQRWSSGDRDGDMWREVTPSAAAGVSDSSHADV